jgi:hypothetical protein
VSVDVDGDSTYSIDPSGSIIQMGAPLIFVLIFYRFIRLMQWSDGEAKNLVASANAV